MNRRSFLVCSLAGLSLGFDRLLTVDNPGAIFLSCTKLINDQVATGTLEAATLYTRIKGKVEVSSFGKAETVDAVFLLASITKTMTATGVMVLADAGELRISDKVRKFIPEFSEGDRKDVTIQQLLTHTSGLPDQLPENDALRKRHAPLSEFVEHAIRTPLLFKPGTRCSYQSMGILLAAEVVQRITGTPLPAYLKDNVFKPLGMERTALGLRPFQLADTVRSQTEYAAPESGSGSEAARDWDWNSPYWRKLGAPWGGAHGTVRDVARFLESFLNLDGTVLRKE
ncbi:MAG: beta-lactamase family protein, partial [Verrucomicrobiae bacterium]|nr:beta-lactamase family protein [Verrucomicrobiae bacterium]